MVRTTVGLVGEAGAGKGEIAGYLHGLGFAYYSLSDSIRRIATGVRLPHNREALISIGNALRENLGDDVLARGAQRWLERENISKGVIDSIRNPAEVRFLQRELSTLVVGVTMSPEKRFELMLVRKREGDPKNWEEFQALLRLEQGEGQSTSGVQIKQCLDLADAIVQNDGTLEELHLKTNEMLVARGILLEGYTSNRERTA